MENFSLRVKSNEKSEETGLIGAIRVTSCPSNKIVNRSSNFSRLNRLIPRSGTNLPVRSIQDDRSPCRRPNTSPRLPFRASLSCFREISCMPANRHATLPFISPIRIPAALEMLMSRSSSRKIYSGEFRVMPSDTRLDTANVNAPRDTR